MSVRFADALFCKRILGLHVYYIYYINIVCILHIKVAAATVADASWFRICTIQSVVSTSLDKFNCRIYRAMLCIRGTSHGPVSVRLSVRPSVCQSVTSRSSTKTAKRRITQTTPHDSPVNLVFWSQISPRNSTGVTPYGGAKCRWGGSKSATFDK